MSLCPSRRCLCRASSHGWAACSSRAVPRTWGLRAGYKARGPAGCAHPRAQRIAICSWVCTVQVVRTEDKTGLAPALATCRTWSLGARGVRILLQVEVRRASAQTGGPRRRVWDPVAVVCCPAQLEVQHCACKSPGPDTARAACAGQRPEERLASGQGSAQHGLGMESSQGEALQPGLLRPPGLV